MDIPSSKSPILAHILQNTAKNILKIITAFELNIATSKYYQFFEAMGPLSKVASF